MTTDALKNHPTEIINIAIRYRCWIGVCALIAILLCSIYMYLNPHYESRAVLRIGQLRPATATGPVVLVEDLGLLTRRIQGAADVSNRTISVVIDRNVANFITLKLQGPTPQAAQNMLAEEVNSLLAYHKELWQQALEANQQKNKETIKTINETEQTLQGLNQNLALEHENSMKVLINLEKSNLIRVQVDMKRQLEDSKRLEGEPFMTPTSVVSPPSLPTTSFTTPIVLASVAFFAGLTFGLVSAFAHYYAKRVLAKGISG